MQMAIFVCDSDSVHFCAGFKSTWFLKPFPDAPRLQSRGKVQELQAVDQGLLALLLKSLTTIFQPAKAALGHLWFEHQRSTSANLCLSLHLEYLHWSLFF